MFGRSFLLSLSIAAMVLAAGGPGLVAQEVIDQEARLKATYLYYFVQYITWPKNAVPGDDKTFIIGVLGPNSFGEYLDALARKTVEDKKIVIRRFTSAKDYEPCHILFISALPDDKAEEKTVEDRVKAALAKTKGSPVLLVSDSEGLAQKGMIINFFVEENKLKLEINKNAVIRSGLKISTKLLGLPNIKFVKSGPASPFHQTEYHARIS